MRHENAKQEDLDAAIERLIETYHQQDSNEPMTLDMAKAIAGLSMLYLNGVVPPTLRTVGTKDLVDPQPDSECLLCGERLGDDTAAWLNGMHRHCAERNNMEDTY